MKRPFIETIPRIEALRVREERDVTGEIGKTIIWVFLCVVVGWIVGYMHCWLAMQP